MEEAEWKKHINPDLVTYIKFNMPWCDFLLPGMCANPAVLEGVVETVKDYVDDIYLIEGIAAARQSFKKGCEINRYTDIVNKATKSIHLLNVGIEKMQEVSIDGVPFPIKIPKILLKEDKNYISVSPIKTHSIAKYSGVLKNSFGVTHHKRVLYHFHLDKVIAGVNKAINPNFGVLDGTVGLEGNGPANGRPIKLNRILCSGDLVALDFVGCRTAHINPFEVPNIIECEKVFEKNVQSIKIRGPLVRKEFEPAKPQKYAQLMFWLMRHGITRKIMFDWLWWLGTWGVKQIRNFWYWRQGKKYVNNFFYAHPKYKEIYGVI